MASMRRRWRKDANGNKKWAGYYATFYDPDRHPMRKEIPLRTRDKQAAKQALAKLEREYAAGSFDPWTEMAPLENVPYREAVTKYIAWMKMRGDRPSTIDNSRFVLELFERFIKPGTFLKQITKEDVTRFTRRPCLMSASTEAYESRIRPFFSWAKRNGLIRWHPMATLPRIKVTRTFPAYLRRKDYDDLLTAIREEGRDLSPWHQNNNKYQWLIDVIQVAVCTGLRRGELINMRWSWIDQKNNFLHVGSSKEFYTKGKVDRTIPLAGDALETIRRLNDERSSQEDDYVFKPPRGGTMLHGPYLSNRLDYFARKIKQPGIHLHSLRHTFASWLVIAGVDIRRVQLLMGHRKLETTMRYAHLSPHDTREAVEHTFGNDSDRGEENRTHIHSIFSSVRKSNQKQVKQKKMSSKRASHRMDVVKAMAGQRAA